jgi:hypothetical protein
MAVQALLGLSSASGRTCPKISAESWDAQIDANGPADVPENGSHDEAPDHTRQQAPLLVEQCSGVCLLIQFGLLGQPKETYRFFWMA